MKKQLIFIIQAYQSATDTGQLNDNVTIELIDKDCKSALKRAESLIKKPFYRISNIIEKEEK